MTVYLRDAQTVVSLLGNDVVASNGNGSAINLQNGTQRFEGDCTVTLDTEAGGSGIVYTIKLTECDTSGGTYTDVTGGAFTATTANTASTQVLFLNASELKQYIKVNKVVAGGSGAGAVSVTALFSNKYG
tara:strand:- start:839 stop:1228 length:390 start_codon:yes stop_codon:yes gene_type:complete